MLLAQMACRKMLFVLLERTTATSSRRLAHVHAKEGELPSLEVGALAKAFVTESDDTISIGGFRGHRPYARTAGPRP